MTAKKKAYALLIVLLIVVIATVCIVITQSANNKRKQQEKDRQVEAVLSDFRERVPQKIENELYSDSLVAKIQIEYHPQMVNYEPRDEADITIFVDNYFDSLTPQSQIAFAKKWDKIIKDVVFDMSLEFDDTYPISYGMVDYKGETRLFQDPLWLDDWLNISSEEHQYCFINYSYTDKTWVIDNKSYHLEDHPEWFGGTDSTFLSEKKI